VRRTDGRARAIVRIERAARTLNGAVCRARSTLATRTRGRGLGAAASRATGCACGVGVRNGVGRAGRTTCGDGVGRAGRTTCGDGVGRDGVADAASGPAATDPGARAGRRVARTGPCMAAVDGKVGFLVGNTPGATPLSATGAAVGLGAWEERGRSRTTPAKRARATASNGTPMAARHPDNPSQAGRAPSTKWACRTSRGSSTLSRPTRTPRTSISCTPNRAVGRPHGGRAVTWTSAEAVPPPGTTIGPAGSTRMRASSSECASSATLSDCSVSLRSVTWSVPRGPATSAGCRSMRTPPPTSTITSMSRDVRCDGVSSETTCTTIGYRPTVVGASGGCTARRTDVDTPEPSKTLGRSRLYQSARRPRTAMRQCSATLLVFSNVSRNTSRPPGARCAVSGRTARRIDSDMVMTPSRFPSPNTRSCCARPRGRSAPAWGAGAPRRRPEAPRR